jgi:hypothetical protein
MSRVLPLVGPIHLYLQSRRTDVIKGHYHM